MKVRDLIVIIALLCGFQDGAGAQSRLKWVIYDFDGLDIGQNNLPDGDYRTGDLSYKVASNPFAPSDMLGDRVLEMDLNWVSGKGEFGKSTNRYIELDANADHLNFYFYNPSRNNQAVTFTVFIHDDDNGDDIYAYADDDMWTKSVTVAPQEGWQLISLPLNSFSDSNPGGNGAFDVGYTGAGGILLKVGFMFTQSSPVKTYEQYFVDMISFSEGPLPHGATVLALPGKSATDYCLLGAYSAMSETQPNKVPDEIEPVFPKGNRLHYINWFLAFSENGTASPNKLPGNEVQDLLNRGYTPIITWEALYNHLARLDPAQPRLSDLLSGRFDAYFDAFGDKLATYSDTVVVRFMHEFEGNWYPWSLTENGKDPNLYIQVFRHVVDRVRARGAGKVKWMWCVNAEPAPYRRYNWVMSAYPGDAYVDIVATDIYNHPNLGVPDWKSFRYTGIESYYYLRKYLPHKPFYICEVASRERYGSEDPGSQTKAQWLMQMNKEMQSFFSDARALIFFSSVKEHDWRVNSSPDVTGILTHDVWDNPYYGFGIASDTENAAPKINTTIFPNPFVDYVIIRPDQPALKPEKLRVLDITGKVVYKRDWGVKDEKLLLPDLKPGVYVLEFRNGREMRSFKIVKAVN